jgi:tetratricopeptide (TPR) repeat protein
MKKLILLISISLFYCNLIFCQGIKFIVLNSTGDISLIRNTIEKTVKVGEIIFDKDKLKVGKYSYANLVYKDGTTLAIRSAGTYNTTKLIKMIASKRNDSARKLNKLVLAEFVKSVDALDNIMVGGSSESIIEASIEYCTPTHTYILDQVITFNWFAVKDNNYTFRLTDFSGNTLYSSELSDTSITLNLQQLNLARDNIYKWYVKDNKSEDALTDTCRFYWLSQPAADSIKKSVERLLADFDKFDHSIKQALLASFYAQNKLYIDMLQAYERAIELSPEIDIYKRLYIEALENLGLERMAEAFRSKQSSTYN